jgi:hypothetical protein
MTLGGDQKVVAIVQRRSRPAVSVSPALAELITVLLVGGAVLILRSLNVLPPDLTLPLWLMVPGAPDLVRAVA